MSCVLVWNLSSSQKNQFSISNSKKMLIFALSKQTTSRAQRRMFQQERWQSGRMRRSWKPLTCEGPGVRIPLFPPNKRCNTHVAAFLFFHTQRHWGIICTVFNACQNYFVLITPKGWDKNKGAEVKTRAELVRAMPSRSNVSKKHRTQCGDYLWQWEGVPIGTRH